MAMQAMLRPGDHVVCIYPGYQSLYELARHSGCKVSLWEPDLQPDGSYAFNVSRFAFWGRHARLPCSPSPATDLRWRTCSSCLTPTAAVRRWTS